MDRELVESLAETIDLLRDRVAELEEGYRILLNGFTLGVKTMSNKNFLPDIERHFHHKGYVSAMEATFGVLAIKMADLNIPETKADDDPAP